MHDVMTRVKLKATNRIGSWLGEFHLKLRIRRVRRECNVTGVDKEKGRDGSARCVAPRCALPGNYDYQLICTPAESS